MEIMVDVFVERTPGDGRAVASAGKVVKRRMARKKTREMVVSLTNFILATGGVGKILWRVCVIFSDLP